MSHLELTNPPPGFDLIKATIDLQMLIRDTRPEAIVQVDASFDFRELLDRLRFNFEAYVREHAEMLDQLPSKEWKTYEGGTGNVPALDEELQFRSDVVRELKFEAIDQLHFLLNVFVALGFDDWDEVLQFYYAKNRENRERQLRGY